MIPKIEFELQTDAQLEGMIDCYQDSYGLPVFACKHCNLKNTKKPQILKHLRLLGKEKDIECDKCGRKFADVRYLKYHNERVHEKKVKHECFVCGKGYRDKASLRSHLNIHDEARTPPKIFKETHLPKELQTELESSESVVFEEKELPKNLVCKFCAKIFMSQQGRVRHEKNHQDEEKHKRIMDSLEFEATHKEDVKNVIKKENVKIERNLFNVTETAPVTSKLESDEKTFLFKCKTCFLQFSSSKLLRTHKCLDAEPDKNFVFKCKTCFRHFASSKLLRTHDCQNAGQPPGKHEDVHNNVKYVHNVRNVKDVENVHSVKDTWESPPNIDDLTEVENKKNILLQKIKSIENRDDEPAVFDSTANEIPNEKNQQSTAEENDEQMMRSQSQRVPRRKYKKRPLVNCPKCEKTFRSEREMKSHVTRHSFPCSGCGKLLKNERAVQRHLLLHARENATDKDPEEEKNSPQSKIYDFICDICERGLSSEEDLVKHRESHKRDVIYQCKNCDQTFVKNKMLLNHMMVVHDMKRDEVSAIEHKCVHCDFKTDKRRTLEGHLRNHKTERFICTECGKKLKGKISMKHHMKKHKGIYDFQCEECEKKFVSPGTLRGHTLARHSNAVFICEECGTEFKLKQQYKNHLTLHTGERKIPCRAIGCRKMFRSYNARSNCETAHKGIKNFKCKLCSKLFLRRNSFKLHTKRHEGIKNHTCATCGRAFVEPAGARKCKHSGIEGKGKY